MFGEAYLSAFGPIYSQKRANTEANFILRQVRLKPGDRLLDLACGQGRHAIEFAGKGIKVVGVDYSSVLLRAARASAQQAGVVSEFVKGDMRHLSLRQMFDAVVILGNAFGYFDDLANEQVIAGVAKHLKKRGVFVLDLANTAGMMRGLFAKSTHKIPDGTMTAENVSFDPVNFYLFLRWSIKRGREVQRFHGRLRLYTLPEIRLMLAKHRFLVKKVFGSFEGEEFDFNSPRCLIVAEKI